MNTYFISSLLLSFFLMYETKKAPVPEPHPYVVNIRLDFKEDMMSTFVAESIFRTFHNYLEESDYCNISAYDVAKIISTKKIAIKDFIGALDYLNISASDEDTRAFLSELNYTDLSSTGFSTEKMYKKFVKTYFKDDSANLLKCLDIFGITGEFSAAYAFGTDEDMFTALQGGNYSKENILAAVDLINTTEVTLKDVLSILGSKRLEGTYFQDFFKNLTEYLYENNLKMENFIAFLDVFNFTVSDYRNIASFKSFHDSHMRSASGVAVSSREVVTNDYDLLDTFARLGNYTILTATATGSTYAVIDVLGIEFGHAKLTLEPDVLSYVNITEHYRNMFMKSCKYVTENQGLLITQNTTVKLAAGALTIEKSNGTLFKVSSPLLCEGTLYGLAATNQPNQITFDVFHDLEEVTPDEYKVFQKVLLALKSAFDSFFNTIDPCQYVECEAKTTV